MADKRRRSTRDLERTARRVSDVMLALLAPSAIPKRGTVLADLLYRAQYSAVPDGFPTSSMSASPQLERSASQPGLRTGLEDALRRKRGHGYSEDSPVEKAVEARLEDVCPECEGRPTEPNAKPCKACQGSGRRYHDPISEAVVGIIAALEGANAKALIIDRKSQVVLHARDNAPAEIELSDCDGCHRKVNGGRADPIRRGLCGACTTAYGRWRIDNGSNDESGDRSRFCVQRKRHDDHVEATCDLCAQNRRKAGDDWRLDRADEMRDQRRAS